MALNAGVVPASFASAGAGVQEASVAIQHFAEGGAVASAPRGGGEGSSADSSVPRPVNVAFFDDRAALNNWVNSSEGEMAILNVVKKNSYMIK